MKNALFFRCVVCTVGIFLMALSGCARTAPSKFYILNSLQDSEAEQQTAPSAYDFTIGVGPIVIPEYLDRPQIVTRTGQNELNLGQFDRWAGPFKENISRAIMENLTVLLAGDRISVISWGPLIPVKYQIAVGVKRFDAVLDGSVSLTAQWVIFEKDGRSMLMMRESRFSEPIDGQGYAAIAAAMSKALENLSRDIAAALTSVSH